MDFLKSLMNLKFCHSDAISDGSEGVSYSFLIEKATRFAAYLNSKNICNVIIKTARSSEAIISAIGVMLSGGVFAFLSDNTPEEYLISAKEDLKADLVVDDNIDFSVFPMPDPDYKPIRKRNQDVVCAVFTSGSTGKPKGALLTYRALCETIRFQTEYMNLPVGSHTGSYAQFGFIASFWEIWFPLTNGFTLFLADKKTAHDTGLLIDFIDKNNLSYIFLPASVAGIFTEIYNGGALRFLRVAGGRLSSCGKPKGYEILYSLGMSENSGSVTLMQINEAMSGQIPLGKAFDDTEIYLIDGEIAVSGPKLFAGYAGQKALTEKSLVINPYSNGREDYAKMYLSGDLAELDTNGNYIYKGRRDWIVKIGDIKTNPLETERVILENTGVKEAAVIPITRAGGDVFTACFYAGEISEKVLRNFAKTRLIPASIPSYFVKLSALPKTDNGKIDRRTLKLPEIKKTVTSNVDMSETEKIIVSAFEEILSLDKGIVSRDDSFFALGGNSLGLMRLQALLYKKYSFDLSYSDLLAAQTPRNIALLKTNRKVIKSTEPKLHTPYHLTAPERQMWLLWRTGQDNGRYTVRIRCDYDGVIDISKAKISLEKLLQKNPVLSSFYAEENGEISRYFSDDKITFSDTEPSQFDLNKGPLFAAVLSENSQENSIVFSAHHIIADAAAMRVLMEDFWAFYNGEETESAVSLHDLEMYEESIDYGKDKAFWQSKLEGFKYIPLPDDNGVYFSNEEAEKIKNRVEKTDEKSFTIFSIFTAAVATHISRITQSKKVCIGVPLSGRNLPETIRTIGMLVRTIPLYIDVSDDFSETVKTISGYLQSAVVHQNYPFELMNENFGVRYDVMVNLLPLPQKLKENGLSPRIIRGSYPASPVTLVCDLREEESGFSVIFTYEKPQARLVENFASKTQIDDFKDAWKAILGKDEGDFYEIGGTSLKAIRIEEAMLMKGHYISAADILRYKNFSDISKLIISASEIDWEAE
ncbi:MAG: AMP-binding protein [Ruminococcus sp.]|jgi:acyl-coenzyme A synthetase/AMP-(fatty) acid ligase/acyl carrier protein|nr:AMP-binding protein [Ruminococcus sp.]